MSAGGENEMKSEDLLLSPQGLRKYSAEEFLAYVQSLYGVREKRSLKPKSATPGLSCRRSKSGKPSVTCRRDWKWMTEAELELLAAQIAEPLNSFWIYVRDAKFTLIKDTVRE